MPLPTPRLDDRTFQDIFSEARSRIPRYCPEWTDFNLSDPGITIVELFSWMTEMILYRLNKVPDKNYIKFLEMMGVSLQPPCAASVDVTFHLSAPQTSRVNIPAGTEVATVRTETEEAIVFSTEIDLAIDVPHIVECLATSDGRNFEGRMPALEVSKGQFLAFDPKPRSGNALLLGLGGDLARNTIVLSIDCEIEGIGVDPDHPPLAWEVWCGEEEWKPVEIVKDTTGGLNRNGVVEMILPPDLVGTEISGHYAHCWLRCGVTEPKPRQPFYERSPRIKGIVSTTMGGTVPATHSTAVTGEDLGLSDGNPGETYQLRNHPVLARSPGEVVEVVVSEGEKPEIWSEVADFADSGSADRHFVCDGTAGLVMFGPSIRQPDGTVRQHGAAPARGARIRFSSYRYGGGVVGNVAAGTLTVLKSSIPYVARVTNRRPARGGANAESLERAMLHAPKLLRARHRAVTAEDFEAFALEASSAVNRVKCLGAGGSGGIVSVVVVPNVADPRRLSSKVDLTVGEDVKNDITEYLNERCLVTIEAEVRDAEYTWTTVEVQIFVPPGSDQKGIQALVEEKLYDYINPFSGGPRKEGWPFGRDLAAFELYALLQGIAGVEALGRIRLLTSDERDGQLTDGGQYIRTAPGGLLCSGQHRVEVHETQ